MGERLRPLSSSWMAPYSLAAQLTAQAGQSMGNAFASLGDSIGRGISTGTARRENERRYNEQMRMQNDEFALKQSEIAYRHDQDSLELAMALGRQHAAQAASLVQSGLAIDDPRVVEATEKSSQYIDSLKSILTRTPGAAGSAFPKFPGPGAPVVPMGGEGGPVLPVQGGGDLPTPPEIPYLTHAQASALYRDAEEAYQAASEAAQKSPASRMAQERLAAARTRVEALRVAVNGAAARDARLSSQESGSGRQTPEEARSLAEARARGEATVKNEQEFGELGRKVRELSAVEPLAPDMEGRAAQLGRLRAQAESLKDAREQKQALERMKASADHKILVAQFKHDLPPKPDTMTDEEYAKKRVSDLRTKMNALKARLDPMSGVILTRDERIQAQMEYDAARDALVEEIDAQATPPPKGDESARRAAATAEYNALPADQRTAEAVEQIRKKYGL